MKNSTNAQRGPAAATAAIRRLAPVLLGLAFALHGVAAADGINPGIYLAAGDSITEGYDGETWWSRGYLPYLADLLEIGESQIVNIGIGGATAEDGLVNFRRRLVEVMPQYVLILFGTNDISHSVPRGETLAALEAMVDAARTVGSIPILGTVIPRGPHEVDTSNRGALALNALILELAGGTEGTGWADNFNTFLDNPCAPLECGPGEPDFIVDDLHYDLCCYYSDSLHPSQRGYQLLAQSWYAGLLDRGSDPPLPGDFSAPWVAERSPGDGETGVPPETGIFIRINDLGNGVNSASIFLSVGGAAIPPERFSVSGTPDSLEITYTPEIPFTNGSFIEVAVSAADLAIPPNLLESERWFFHVSDGGGQTLGDIDSSGRIDGLDLALLAFAFGSFSGDAHYLESADLNRDGVVDGEDLARLAAYFGDTFPIS